MNKLFLAATVALSSVLTIAAVEPAPTARETPVPALAPEQTAPDDADPALWLVRDEDTTIYLFGTFHLLDDRPWFDDEIRRAFESSDELVVEAILPENPADVQPLIMRYALDPQGRRLSQRLSPEQNSALAQALATFGAPATAFDTLEPWFVSMTLAMVASQRLGISAANGPEGVLVRAARERSMPVAELEGLEWQIRLFDGMPEEQQLAQLRRALDDMEGLSQSLAPMLAAWATGDVQALERIIELQGGEDPGLHRLLFTERNRTWADWIQERMARPGVVFLAVGAGHLTGRDSVQASLEGRGIRSERVASDAPSTAGPS